MSVHRSGRTLADVAVDLTVQCIDDEGTQHDIDTVLGFRRQDPYAVTMTFLTADGDLTWTFARDLLVTGLDRATGEGDVRVTPIVAVDAPATVDIELSSPDGHLVLHTRADQVADFVSRSQRMVPVGTESLHLDIDGLVAQLLNAG